MTLISACSFSRHTLDPLKPGPGPVLSGPLQFLTQGHSSCSLIMSFSQSVNNFSMIMLEMNMKLSD